MNNMSISDIVICAVGALTSLVFIFSPRAKDYIKSVLCGVFALLLVNAASIFTGTAVKISVGTVGSAVFFGVPGVIMSLIFNLI